MWCSGGSGSTTWLPLWARDDLVVTHQIRRHPSGEGYEIVQTSEDTGWQCWAVGCGAPVLFVIGGLWLVVRLFRGRKGRPAA